MRPAHVQRCGELRAFGEGPHARLWQCLRVDPHTGLACDFGTDAEVYGRPLDTQRPEWLAAHLRDAQAQLRNRQRRIDEVTAVAAQLTRYAVDNTPLSYAAGMWVRKNLPSAAVELDAKGPRWCDAVAPR